MASTRTMVIEHLSQDCYFIKRLSGVVPFGTMFAWILICFGIFVPLVSVGSNFGYQPPAISNPVIPTPLWHPILAQAWPIQQVSTIFIVGALQFIVVFLAESTTRRSVVLHLLVPPLQHVYNPIVYSKVDVYSLHMIPKILSCGRDYHALHQL
jgi:hypothetical protein